MRPFSICKIFHLLVNIASAAIHYPICNGGYFYHICTCYNYCAKSYKMFLSNAAQPKTNYSNVNITYEVQLPDMDSTVMTELVCDIQPGALIQRYSVQWLKSTSDIVGNTFNITVNISASSEGETYHCTVFIHHNGQGLILPYSGKHIIIKTLDSGATDGQIPGIVLSTVVLCSVCSIHVLVVMCIIIWRVCKNDLTRRFNQLDDDRQQEYVSSTAVSMNNISVPSSRGSALMESHQMQLTMQSVEDMETILLAIPIDSCIPWHENITADNEPTPSPCSGPAIDPHNTQNYLPKWFTAMSSHLHCTHTGMTYYNDPNDFRLEIPEGAIPRGKIISIDIGVALYGPFQFPPGMRPVSPVFWVCVRQTNFSHFLKNITITLPHFLSLKLDEDIRSVGLTFLKAQHEMNHHQMYEFQPAEGKECFWPFKKSGVLETTHFCSLCISCKDTMEAIKMATFCVTAVKPCVIPVGESHVDFYITFLLSTCLTKLNEQLQASSHAVERYKKPFQFRGEGNQALELILPESVQDWSFGCRFTKKVYNYDV